MAEAMKLLDQLSEAGAFHTGVFLTYGADFAFFEEAVLSAIWKQGCRNSLILVDAHRYADTIKQLGNSARGIGQRYIVVPVDLGTYRSFHPKLVLLLGHQRGRLLIGSGNLTFTGYGYNREVFTRLDWSPDIQQYHSLFFEAWGLTREINRRWGHSSTADLILNKAQQVADWLSYSNNSSAPVKLFHSLDEALIAQCTRALAGEEFQSVTVVTPFLDDGAKALETIWTEFRPAELTLVLQPRRAVGNTESLTRLREAGCPLRVLQLLDTSRYLHAKVYIFKTRDKAYALTGSANCTRAAWLASVHNGGNVETVLLQVADEPDHYDYLFQGLTAPVSLDALDTLQLRRPIPTQHEGTQSLVGLLDATVKQGILHISYEVRQPLTEVQNLLLHQSRGSSRPLNLSGPLGEGQHLIQRMLDEVLRDGLHRTTHVSLRGSDSSGNVIDLHSNSLWVTNQDVWHYYINRQRSARLDTGASLGAQELGDAAEWQDLYDALVELVELDVAALKRRGGTYTASPGEGAQPSDRDESEKETEIRFVDEAPENADYDEVVEALYRESPLYSWFEYVRGRLPGQVRDESSDNTPTEPDSQPKQVHRRRKHTPDERMGRRFTNLVKKYVGSLHNSEYMDIVSLYHILTYYSVFHRIAWLLFQHHVFKASYYAQLATDINEGFFGSPSKDPPALHPQRRRYIQRTWKGEWLSHEVAGHALVSSALALRFAADAADTELVERAELQLVQVLCAVVSIVGIQWLEDAPEWLVQADKGYQMEEASVVSLLGSSAKRLLSVADSTLITWARRSSIHAANTSDPRSERLLYSARIEYTIARHEIAALSGDLKGQRALCANIVFWLGALREWERASEWSDNYIALLAVQGDQTDIARELFRQGRSSLFARDYEDAERKLREASLLAENAGDHQLAEQSEKLLQHVTALFLKHVESD